jgi:hypothetical protein
MDVAITPDAQYLFVATTDGIYRYDMAGNGTLIVGGFSSSNITLAPNGDIFAEIWPHEIYQISGNLTPIPEPSSFALIAVGIVGLIGYGWRRRRT